MKKIICALLSLSLLLLCGCSLSVDALKHKAEELINGKEPAAQTGNFIFTQDNYPKMGGSLANLPLGEAITATVLGISRSDADALISFKGSTTDNYKALCAGDFDILLAYEPSEEAKEYMEESGSELLMTPIGVDALVFICSKENPVESLTVDQIKAIYSGRMTSWGEVGGAGHDIIAYQRNKDSGSQTLFDKLINLGSSLTDAPKSLVVDSMIGLLEAVADYDNNIDALGYTVYYYLTNMEKEKLDTCKILSVDSVAPTNESISDGSYPLVNDFYVVIRNDAGKESPERILYNWICSSQGRALVERENYPVRISSPVE